MGCRSAAVAMILLLLVAGCQIPRKVQTPIYPLFIDPDGPIKDGLVLRSKGDLAPPRKPVCLKRGASKAVRLHFSLCNLTDQDLFIAELQGAMVLQWRCHSFYPDGDERVQGGVNGNGARSVEPVRFRRLCAMPRGEESFVEDRPFYFDIRAQIPLPADPAAQYSLLHFRFPLPYWGARCTEPAILWFSASTRITYKD